MNVYDKAGGKFEEIAFSSSNLLNMEFHRKSDNEVFKVTSLHLQGPYQSQSNARVYYQKITYSENGSPVYSYPAIVLNTEDFFRIGELVLDSDDEHVIRCMHTVGKGSWKNCLVRKFYVGQFFLNSSLYMEDP